MALCKSVWHVAQSNPTVFSTRPGELILIYELSRLICFSSFYTHFLFLFALDIVLMEWQQWGKTSSSFAVGRVHLGFSKLWKPVEEFKAILRREDQQLQKHPGSLRINRDGCGQLHTLCLPGWNCYTHLWPVYAKPLALSNWIRVCIIFVFGSDTVWFWNTPVHKSCIVPNEPFLFWLLR